MTDCTKSNAFERKREGAELVDVKFFRGDDHSVTHEDFMRVSEEIDRQMETTDALDVSEIDGHFKTVNINTVLN